MNALQADFAAGLEAVRDKADPVRLAIRAGITPDPWQERVLRSTSSAMMLNCARQIGKSTAVALIITRYLLLPEKTVVIAAPSEDQSKELWHKVLIFWRRIGRPVAHVTVGKKGIELVNGTRVLVRSGNEGTSRGYTADLLVLDEASQVADALFDAVMPMLSVSGGRLLAPSTPFGRRGWWYRQCRASCSPKLAYLGPLEDDIEPDPDIDYVEVPVTESTRHSAKFLASARRKGQRHYDQEFMCKFQENIGSLFGYAEIQAAMNDDVAPLFGEEGW